MVRLTSLFFGSVGLLLCAVTVTQVLVIRSSYDTIKDQEYNEYGELLTQRFRDKISGRLRSLRSRIDQAATMITDVEHPYELADTARQALSSTISSDLNSNLTALYIIDHSGKLLLNLSAKRIYPDTLVTQLQKSFNHGSHWTLHYSGTGKDDHLVLLYRKALRGRNGKLLAWICGGLQLDGSFGLVNYIRDTMDLRVAGLIFKNREPLLIANSNDHTLLASLQSAINENRIQRQTPAQIATDQPLFWLDSLPINPALTDVSMVLDMPTGVTSSFFSIQRTTTLLTLLATAALTLVCGVALQWLFRASVARTLSAAESAATGSATTDSKRNIITEFDQVEQSFEMLVRKLHIESEERRRAQGITQQQAAIAERQVDQLRELNGQLEQFTFSASHDLKSPLSTISGLANAAIISMQEDDEPALVYSLNRIEMQSRQLGIRITQILEILRTNHIETTWVSVNLQSLVADIWQNAIDMGEKQLQLECYPDPLPTVPAAFELMRGILENLLSNSIKYRDPEKLRCIITIRVSQDTKGVQLEVEDNGVGIDDIYHKDLFQMFKRFSTLDVPGSGLGLALVKRYIIKMNGSISYERLPKGSRFTLRWKPPEIAQPAPTKLLNELEKAPSKLSSTLPSSALLKPKLISSSFPNASSGQK